LPRFDCRQQTLAGFSGSYTIPAVDVSMAIGLVTAIDNALWRD
jgi:hypothetical protein